MGNRGPVPLFEQRALSAARSEILKGVSTPLGFSTYALAIVEAVLLAIILWAPFSEYVRVATLVIVIALFLYVFRRVMNLVEKHPTNLVYSEASHLRLEELRIYGTREHPLAERTVIEALPAVAAPQPPPGQVDASGSAEAAPSN